MSRLGARMTQQQIPVATEEGQHIRSKGYEIVVPISLRTISIGRSLCPDGVLPTLKSYGQDITHLLKASHSAVERSVARSA